MVKISDVRNEQGVTMVKADINGEHTEDYRVTYLDDQKVILVYRDKKENIQLYFETIIYGVISQPILFVGIEHNGYVSVLNTRQGINTGKGKKF